MLINYFKISLRLLTRDPFFSGINVVGLAIGFASFYALWEYSISELRSDQYHKDADRIARLCTNWQWSDDGGATWGHITAGAAISSMFPRIQEDFPEVQSTQRILHQSIFTKDIVNHGKKTMITIDEEIGQPRVF